MPLEPLICRSRYGKVKESYKNQRKFGESENIRIFVVFKKTKNINRSTWNNKNKIIMKTITFIAEFRNETNKERNWATIRETTISKALKKAEIIGKANNIKLIGIREA